MPTQILTTDDLYQFKLDLMDELRALFGQHKQSLNKPFLKSAEVRRLLSISPGTLQHLRKKGTLPSSKIGNILYYDAAEIEAILSGKQHEQKSLP